jgi:hypothetical protein
LARRLTERIDEDVKGDVAYWAAFYEHRVRLGSKPIFHLEGEFCEQVDKIGVVLMRFLDSFLRQDHE